MGPRFMGYAFGVGLCLTGCGGSSSMDPTTCRACPCLAQVTATYDFVRLVRRSDGSVWRADPSSEFTRVDAASAAFTAQDIAASGSSAYANAIGCAINDGGVWCFAIAGPLSSATDLGAGLAADPQSPLPQRVVTGPDAAAPALEHVVQLAGGMNGGGASFCAVTKSGGIWCWGYDEAGLLGHGDVDGAGYARPVMMDASTPFEHAVEVRVGYASSCARTQDGSVWCWGDNGFGELGFAPTLGTGSLAPVRVTLAAPAKRLAASPGNTECAILEDTRVQCWGRNEYAEAGASSETPVVGPTIVLAAADGRALDGVLDVAPDRGMKAMCANTSKTGLACWGDAFLVDEKSEPIGPYAAAIGDPNSGPGAIQVPLSAYGARDGSLVLVDGQGRLVFGAGAVPASVQPPCP